MRTALWALVASAMAMPGRAEPPKTHALKDLFDNGFAQCIPYMEKLVREAHKNEDSYAYLGVWSMDRPDGQMATIITSEELETGHSVTTISAVKSEAGTCDVTMTQSQTAPGQSCLQVRDTAFKAWLFYGDFNKAQVYQDPSTPNAKVVLTPFGAAGCLIVKNIVAYGKR